MTKDTILIVRFQMLTRQISRSEVSCHDSPDDCWMIIRNVVYDVTPFLLEHPGSTEVLLEYVSRTIQIFVNQFLSVRQ